MISLVVACMAAAVYFVFFYV
jgi:hypothetical protein